VLAPRERLAGTCARHECRRVRVVARRLEDRRRERAEFLERATALRARVARAAGVSDVDAFPVAPLPRYLGRTTRLPAARRRALAERLAGLATALLARRAGEGRPARPPSRDVAAAPPDPPPSGELATVLGRACGRCRGHCCRNGAEHAYLDEEAVGRWLDAHPGATAADVVAAYVAHLGARTYEGSCVYHGRHGCTLPRDMRAALCNRFFCGELRTFQASVAAGAPARAFFASDPGDGVRGAFVDARD
jgi:hypothetical protein